MRSDEDRLVATADGLGPSISARTGEIEAMRRLPGDLVDALATAGLFKLCVPKVFGGSEVSPATMLRVIESVSRADGAAGWCVMIAATSGTTAAYLPPEVAQMIHGSPGAVTGGVLAPRGRAVREGDVLRINGHWQWASGNPHCTWMKGGCLITEDGKVRTLGNGAPVVYAVYMPRDRLRFVDNWQTLGMAGTMSCDMIAEDIVVPLDHAVSVVAGSPRIEAPLYRFPIFGLLALGVAAVALGIARGAIDDAIRLATDKVPDGSRRTLAERDATKTAISRADAMVGASRSWLLQAISEAEVAAARERDMPLQPRAKLRQAAAWATENAAEATRMMYMLAGGTSVYRAHPLERRFRDVHVATQHIMVGDRTHEVTGRVLLGLPTDASML